MKLARCKLEARGAAKGVRLPARWDGGQRQLGEEDHVQLAPSMWPLVCWAATKSQILKPWTAPSVPQQGMMLRRPVPRHINIQ